MEMNISETVTLATKVNATCCAVIVLLSAIRDAVKEDSPTVANGLASLIDDVTEMLDALDMRLQKSA